MTAKQQIGDAGFVAGKDIFVQEVHLSTAGKSNDGDLLLVTSQRNHLNALVRDVATATGKNEGFVWTEVHRKFGVGSINEICRRQYPLAVEFLEGQLAAQDEATTCDSLVHHILSLADKANAREAMNGHCRRTFGSTRLKSMNREQLVSVLRFVEELPVTQPAQLSKRKLNFIGTLIQWVLRWF